MSKGIVALLVVGAAVGIGAAVAITHQSPGPKLAVGDVFQVWDSQAGTFVTYTVMGISSGQYQIQEGTYPSVSGSILSVNFAVIDNDPSLQKIGNVNIGQ